MGRRSVIIITLFLLAACSDSSEQSGNHDSWQAGTAAQSEKKLSLFDEIKTRIKLGGEVLKSAQEVIDKQPEALSILQGRGSAQDWKALDKSFLKERAKELENKIAASGLSPDKELSTSDRMMLGVMGKQLGISDKRAAELEKMARSKMAKDAGRFPDTSTAGKVGSGTGSVNAGSGLQTPAAAYSSRPQAGEATVKPHRTDAVILSTDGTPVSDELRAIFKRRQERLAEVANAANLICLNLYEAFQSLFWLVFCDRYRYRCRKVGGCCLVVGRVGCRLLEAHSGRFAG